MKITERERSFANHQLFKASDEEEKRHEFNENYKEVRKRIF